MKVWDPSKIRARINEVLPQGMVHPRHNEKGHFYEVKNGTSYDPETIQGPVYPSVTGKLQILKDEGLINYKMNRAIESLANFIYSNYKKFDDASVMAMIEEASKIAARVSQDILEDAGDIGTRIHNVREAIFEDWIKNGKRPENFLAFIPESEMDVRVTSGIRALQKFCVERDYIPVACELLVYSHKLKVAGTLDDLGLVRMPLSKGEDGCEHEMMDTQHGKKTCMRCGYQLSRHRFALMDLKTSNQFKDHYFFQVSLYSWMFTQLTGLKPEEHFILKVSKEDGNYKIEDLKKAAKLAEYARYMLKTNEGVEFIKSLRKDNQKVVAPVMQL